MPQHGGFMLRWVIVLMFLATPALADSITIGTLSYLGPNSQGLSQFQIELDTNGVTAQPFTGVVGVLGNKFFGGTAFTIPTTAAFTETIVSGVFNCPCSSIFFC